MVPSSLEDFSQINVLSVSVERNYPLEQTRVQARGKTQCSDGCSAQLKKRSKSYGKSYQK